jgi:RNA polymerase sigma factor (sigma-70 family)
VTVDQNELLAERFEGHRARLRAVAYRMLGSLDEADDAVQESWLRLSRAGAEGIENLGGWLTTVVARVCLDMLRSRASRREDSLDGYAADGYAADGYAAADGHEDLSGHSVTGHPASGFPVRGDPVSGHPEQEAMLADSVGAALLVVLDSMAPAERLAFVLHDVFAVPFDEIASTLGRTEAAARQLASRGRRRVQAPRAAPDAQRALQRKVVEAFLAASRNGDFAGLLGLLDPEAAVRADPAAVAAGASGEIRGAAAVAESFSGRARAAKLALVDGYAGAVWAPGGQPRVVFGFTIEDGRIIEIELLADPEQLSRLDLALPDR